MLRNFISYAVLHLIVTFNLMLITTFHHTWCLQFLSLFRGLQHESICFFLKIDVSLFFTHSIELFSSANLSTYQFPQFADISCPPLFPLLLFCPYGFILIILILFINFHFSMVRGRRDKQMYPTFHI